MIKKITTDKCRQFVAKNNGTFYPNETQLGQHYTDFRIGPLNIDVEKIIYDVIIWDDLRFFFSPQPFLTIDQRTSTWKVYERTRIGMMESRQDEKYGEDDGESSRWVVIFRMRTILNNTRVELHFKTKQSDIHSKFSSPWIHIPLI